MTIPNNKVSTIALTIALGETRSDVLGPEFFYDAKSMQIVAPASLAETVTVKSARTADPDDDYAAAQSPPGTDIIVPEDSSVFLTFSGTLPFIGLILEAGVGVAADRTFYVHIAR